MKEQQFDVLDRDFFTLGEFDNQNSWGSATVKEMVVAIRGV